MLKSTIKQNCRPLSNQPQLLRTERSFVN